MKTKFFFLSIFFFLGFVTFETQAATWSTEVVDSSASSYHSIKIDHVGHLHLAYGGNSDLKHATNASGSWVTETIDGSGTVGYYVSLAIDSHDFLHISYYDSTDKNLKYATNVSGSWAIETVASSGDVGTYNSLAVDSNNFIHISYYDASNKDLKHATNVSGSWVTETVASSGDVGMYNSLAVDSNNFIHISYYDSSNYDLKYATNASGGWVIETRAGNSGDGDGTDEYSPGLAGKYSSLAIDSNDFIHISYYNQSTGNLNYTTNTSGSWVTEIVDGDEGGEENGGIDVGSYTSLAIDSNGFIHISYYSKGYSELKYTTNVSGSWVDETVNDDITAGKFSSLVVDSSGFIHIGYYDHGLGLEHITNQGEEESEEEAGNGDTSDSGASGTSDTGAASGGTTESDGSTSSDAGASDGETSDASGSDGAPADESESADGGAVSSGCSLSSGNSGTLSLMSFLILFLPTLFAAGVRKKPVLMMLSLLFLSQSAQAATINVTENSGDALTTDGICSLREAVINTNNNSRVYADCIETDSYGDDTLVLPSGVYCLSQSNASSADEDASATGDLDIRDDLIVTGSGSENTIIDAGGSTESTGRGCDSLLGDRVLDIIGDESFTVSLSDLTITGGSVSGTIAYGGGIYINVSTLSLNDSIVSENSAEGSSSAYGGGIYVNASTLRLTDSTLSGNRAQGSSVASGGGISVDYSTLGMVNSTFSGNSAQSGSHAYGGAIAISFSSILGLINSTLSENSAEGSFATFGGAISIGDNGPSMASLINSTLSGNSAQGNSYAYGGGISSSDSTTIQINMQSTILSGNSVTESTENYGGAECYGDGSWNSYGYNFIATATTSSNCSFTDMENPGTDITTKAHGELLLGDLADNGGATETRALQAGSPAVNTGSCTDIGSGPLTTDQRGYTRDSQCDIGAYEYIANEVNNCSDGVDNDSDGLTDNGDSDCGSVEACSGASDAVEICGDGIDQNCDGVDENCETAATASNHESDADDSQTPESETPESETSDNSDDNDTGEETEASADEETEGTGEEGSSASGGCQLNPASVNPGLLPILFAFLLFIPKIYKLTRP